MHRLLRRAVPVVPLMLNDERTKLYYCMQNNLQLLLDFPLFNIFPHPAFLHLREYKFRPRYPVPPERHVIIGINTG